MRPRVVVGAIQAVTATCAVGKSLNAPDTSSNSPAAYHRSEPQPGFVRGAASSNGTRTLVFLDGRAAITRPAAPAPHDD